MLLSRLRKKEQDKFKRDGVSGKLKQFTFTRGKYKRLAEGPLDQLGADDEAHINANLDYLYEAFCTLVAEKRSLSFEAIKRTETSVLSAPQALEKRTHRPGWHHF